MTACTDVTKTRLSGLSRLGLMQSSGNVPGCVAFSYNHLQRVNISSRNRKAALVILQEFRVATHKGKMYIK